MRHRHNWKRLLNEQIDRRKAPACPENHPAFPHDGCIEVPPATPDRYYQHSGEQPPNISIRKFEWDLKLFKSRSINVALLLFYCLELIEASFHYICCYLHDRYCLHLRLLTNLHHQLLHRYSQKTRLPFPISRSIDDQLIHTGSSFYNDGDILFPLSCISPESV